MAVLLSATEYIFVDCKYFDELPGQGGIREMDGVCVASSMVRLFVASATLNVE